MSLSLFRENTGSNNMQLVILHYDLKSGAGGGQTRLPNHIYLVVIYRERGTFLESRLQISVYQPWL